MSIGIHNQLLEEKELLLLEKKKRMDDLPHLYGQKMYPWQRTFFNSRNKVNLLTAANQIGKSSINIRKAIHWATEKSLWPLLWDESKLLTEKKCPGQFWYLYPDGKLATTEFKEKWVKEFLPRGAMKDDPVYGWKEVYVRAQISEIRFNSGVTIYFKTYMQQPQSLQAGTVYALFCDEELPISLYDEINFRLSGTDGYFHLVFTATLGQDEWRRAMQPEDTEEEFLPTALKIQVSMYDCLYFEDDTPSFWTIEKIKDREGKCATKSEVSRRIHGLFVGVEGRKYNFELDPNTVETEDIEIPEKWVIYAALDYGSGGEKGHPSAIVFVAVNEEHTYGEVIYGRRFDKVETTAGDLVEKYLQEKKLFTKNAIVGQSYDYHCRDLYIIAQRAGEELTPANKKQTDGEELTNTLFGFKALKVRKNVSDLLKLCSELLSLKKGGDKRHAKDDYSDALRYCLSIIPWNLEKIRGESAPKEVKEPTEIDLRRGMMVDEKEEWNEYRDEVSSELREWNALLNS